MKTLLKIVGPILMVVGLLLVAKLPRAAQDPVGELAAHLRSAFDLFGPHWDAGVALIGAGVLCLFLQAFLKDSPGA